ncbi:hypothetical protein OG799_04260 [Micromonospora sp. NBC_00898]|nr:hypothetical protein OG799_04260 [Micromonospora sp. NBC_00898]
MGLSPAVVFVDGQGLQPGEAVGGVVDEADCGYVWLDDVDLLQGCDDQQLQAETLEQGEREAGGVVGATAEGFVDDDEPECAGVLGVETELVGQGRGQDGVGELLFLPSGLAAGVGVGLVFGVVVSPALGGCEGEPVADVGDASGPSAVGLCLAFPAAEALDEGLPASALSGKGANVGSLLVFPACGWTRGFVLPTRQVPDSAIGWAGQGSAELIA